MYSRLLTAFRRDAWVKVQKILTGTPGLEYNGGRGRNQTVPLTVGGRGRNFVLFTG